MGKPFKILFIKGCDGPQAIEVPLGIMYLSAVLKNRLKEAVAIEFLDLRLEKKWARALEERQNTFQPDLVAISLLTSDRPFLDDWSGFVGRVYPQARIVIGGPLASYEYEEILRTHREIDFVVLGEGEVAFFYLVRELIKKGAIDALNGVAFLAGETLVWQGREPLIKDLDSLPFPDYSLIDLDRYTNHVHAMNGVLKEKHTHIISSRGCPYGCLYCHDIFGKKFRARSPENFVAEIRWLYDQYGVREFHIVDDIFNLDKQRMNEILHRIIDSDMQIHIAFPNGIRADLLDETDIRLLKQAGCYMMTFAIETFSDRLQKVIKKNLNLDKALENIKFASETGMITRGFFMLGFPGETIEEIKNTVSLAVRSPLDLAFIFTVVPFKNTGLERLVASEYPHLDFHGSHYWGQIPFYQLATGYPLKRIQTMAYFKFYLPYRIIRTFMKLPNKHRVLLGWFGMAVYIIFTPWYEYFQKASIRSEIQNRQNPIDGGQRK